MLSNFKKTVLTIFCLTVLLVPGFIYAGTFSTDPVLEVFPTNETLEFQANTNQQVTETLSIRNTSETDKIIKVASSPRNEFSYLGSTFITIQANSSETISVQFKSNSKGTYTSELILQHNDTRETKTIRLRAEVFDSNSNDGVSISTNELNFGTKPQDSRTTSTLQINNNNNFDIDISTNNLDKPFRVISAPRSIAANQSETITIEFEPENDSIFDETLTITTSDRRNSNFNVNLKGRGDRESNNKDGSLELDSSQILFTNVATGVSTSRSITIKNPNNFDVKVDLQSDLKSPFSASLQNAVRGETTIRANSSKRLTVVFEPTRQQFYEDEITLATDLNNNQSYSIKIQGNSQLRNTSSNSNNTNNNNNSSSNNSIPFTPQSYNPVSSVKATRNSLNPDLGEISYFQVNFGNEFDDRNNTATLRITDTKLNRVIHTQSARNLNKGLNNWKLQWDGKNSEGNTVLGGSNYTYAVSMFSPSGAQRNFEGSVEVVRNESHIPQVIVQTPSQLRHCLTYTDVNFDSNLCDSLVFAKDQDLLKKDQTKLYPSQTVTRAQALSTLVKLFDLEMETYNPNIDNKLGFSDLDSEDWVMPFIKTVQKYDTKGLILKGYTINNDSKEFRPNQAVNRAELYKWIFELANLDNQTNNDYLMDYFVTERPFKDTQIGSEYDWFTPYAYIAKDKFNHSNFARRYYGSHTISKYIEFCPEHEVTRKEYFETIYEIQKTQTVSFK